MDRKEKISSYYANARELVKQNNPKAARLYILEILNDAVDSYQRASSIALKAKTAAFLDQWIAVSRELYDKGVTDYVLKCFGLPTETEMRLSAAGRERANSRRGKGSPTPASPKRDQLPNLSGLVSQTDNCLPAIGEKSDGFPQKKGSPTSASPIKPKLADGEIDIYGLIKELEQGQDWAAKVFNENKKAVVEIEVSDQNAMGHGTGFIISNKGYLLTCHHVIFNDRTNKNYSDAAMRFSGSEKSYKLKILNADEDADVAFCSFDPNEVNKFEGFGVVKRIADYASVQQGAPCMAIGNPGAMGLAPIAGGNVRFAKFEDNLIYNLLMNPGESGGPVFNNKGECIGIHKERINKIGTGSMDGLRVATPMDIIDELLKKWCDENNIKL